MTESAQTRSDERLSGRAWAIRWRSATSPDHGCAALLAPSPYIDEMVRQKVDLVTNERMIPSFGLQTKLDWLREGQPRCQESVQ